MRPALAAPWHNDFHEGFNTGRCVKYSKLQSCKILPTQTEPHGKGNTLLLVISQLLINSPVSDPWEAPMGKSPSQMLCGKQEIKVRLCHHLADTNGMTPFALEYFPLESLKCQWRTGTSMMMLNLKNKLAWSSNCSS